MGREALENALHNFGVTKKETEVYLFLVKRGPQKTSQINKVLKKNKGQLYRILKNLKNKGLIETTLEYPTRYVATPLENVIDSFIQSKKEEFVRIEETKEDLISHWKKISQSEVDSSIEKFSIIEGNKKIFQKISQMIKDTENQFSAGLTVPSLLKAVHFEIFDLLNERQLNTKGCLRILTQPSANDLNALKLLKAKSTNKIDFRYINPNYQAASFSRMVIRDKDEVVLFISDSNNNFSKTGKEVCLCTNCKSIIESFSRVFNDYWKDSIDIQDRILEIETGKTPSETRVIGNPEIAEKTYNDILDRAKKEILFVTSSKGLIDLEKKFNFENWVEKGIDIKIMSPITIDNLQIAQKLLEHSEVRHVPVGYLETTIIDNSHIFQFGHSTEDEQSDVTSYFRNSFYSNDIAFVKKTKNMIFDIWKKTRTPSSENIRTITSSLPSSSSKIGHHSLFKKTTVSQNMKYQQFETINEENVLEIMRKEKSGAKKGKVNWYDSWKYFGSRAFAVIHPPKNFRLPDMVIGIFRHDKDSSFGEENRMVIDVLRQRGDGFYYVPVTYIQDHPNWLDIRKQVWGGFPVNIITLRKDEFEVRVKGNTLFVGWTKPITLGFSRKKLPPSCLLFEGYGEVKSGMLTNQLPSGRNQQFWFNSFDAFVSYFHPQSKYVGTGTEGFIERDSVFISSPI